MPQVPSWLQRSWSSSDIGCLYRERMRCHTADCATGDCEGGVSQHYGPIHPGSSSTASVRSEELSSSCSDIFVHAAEPRPMTGTAAAEPTVTTSRRTSTDRYDAVELTDRIDARRRQPADRRTLDGVAVVDVQHRNGDVVHELAEPPTFDPGETVEGQVDTAFRTYCMRAHTASHVLYGAGRRLLSDLGYGGFDISARVPDEADDDDFGPAITGKVRVDFETTTEIGDETLTELER